VEVEDRGDYLTGFCPACNRRAYLCKHCDYGTFSLHGVLGHLKKHKTSRAGKVAEAVLSILDTSTINRSDASAIKRPGGDTSAINRDDTSTIERCEGIVSTLEQVPENLHTSVVLAVLLEQQRVVLESLARIEERLASVEEELRRIKARPARLVEARLTPPEAEEDLPSYLRGNPWIEVLSQRG